MHSQGRGDRALSDRAFSQCCSCVVALTCLVAPTSWPWGLVLPSCPGQLLPSGGHWKHSYGRTRNCFLVMSGICRSPLCLVYLGVSQPLYLNGSQRILVATNALLVANSWALPSALLCTATCLPHAFDFLVDTGGSHIWNRLNSPLVLSPSPFLRRRASSQEQPSLVAVCYCLSFPSTLPCSNFIHYLPVTIEGVFCV